MQVEGMWHVWVETLLSLWDEIRSTGCTIVLTQNRIVLIQHNGWWSQH